MVELKAVIPIDDPTDELRRALSEQTGQIRLSELKQAYNGPAFNDGLIGLLEAGEISLYPIGDVVKVEPTKT